MRNNKNGKVERKKDKRGRGKGKTGEKKVDLRNR